VPIVIILATAVIIAIATIRSWQVSRDAIAPMIIFSPMLLYIYAYAPWAVHANDGWSRLPLLFDHLTYVATVNLVFVAAFCIGAVPRNNLAARVPSILWRPIETSPRIREKLFYAGLVLGAIGLIAFCYAIYNSGGPYRVFAKGKPFLSTGSGYIGEAPNLVFPSLILLALAWQGQRLSFHRIYLALLIASPHLVMGTLGGRRGPAFLIIVTLGTCYFVIRKKMPSISTVYFGLFTIGLVLFFLLTQRSNIHLGSSLDFDFGETIDAVAVTNIEDGHETLVSTAGIVVARKTGRYYWGSRYLVMTFIRPIPRQWWPTKYIDSDLEWMESMPGSFGFDDSTWLSNVGFVPYRGNSTGFVTDLFLEFHFAGCLVAYLIGLMYRKVWEQSRIIGGPWTLVYIVMLALSVYLPSQTIQAWWVRMLICVVPALIYWHFFIHRVKVQNVEHGSLASMPPR
jgi:oligosaccharide repeat unit polymerase